MRKTMFVAGSRGIGRVPTSVSGRMSRDDILHYFRYILKHPIRVGRIAHARFGQSYQFQKIERRAGEPLFRSTHMRRA